jgi:tripartite-type tricarboxylate transporter receptor subunit TctC
MLKVQAGIDIEHVPYDSVPAGLAAVMGGHIASVFAAVPGAQPYIQEGRVVGLAVTGPKRVDTLPDVPTMKESGLPDFEAVSWYALYGPAGLPAETRTLLENAFKKLLAENESRTFLEANGMIPDYLAGKELEDYVVTEIGKWGEVAAAAHIERE